MARPSSAPRELHERAVRMLIESKANYGTAYEAIPSISAKLGIRSPESLRKWVRQAAVDGGQRAGKTSEETPSKAETEASPTMRGPRPAHNPKRRLSC